MSKKLAPIIIKRIKKGGHGHHGGAWKIAYADFVTAMMAFFLMMWLLNAVSDDQKKGIADYFAPTAVTMDFRQSGQGILGGDNAQGKLSTRHDTKEDAPPAMQDRGQANFSHKGGESANPDDKNNKGEKKQEKNLEAIDMVSGNKLNLRLVGEKEGENKEKLNIQENSASIRPLTREEKEKNDAKILEKMEGTGSGGLSDQQKQEQENLRKIEVEIENVIKQHESWRPHIRMEITREGLVLNILDLDKKPLFTSGSAILCKYTQDILKEISRIVLNIKNQIIVSGHTDAYNYTNEKLYSNWELSCDRANSARRYMVSQGITRERFKRVDGLEAREPINADNIYAPENRRVRITVVRDHELNFDQLKTLSGVGEGGTPSQEKPKQEQSPPLPNTKESISIPTQPSVEKQPIVVVKPAAPSSAAQATPTNPPKVEINIHEEIPAHATEAKT